MWLTASHYQTVFWIAVIPAFLSVAVLLIYVKEPKPVNPPKTRPAISRAYLKCLGGQYWSVLAVGVIFTLARFSEAFLILRAGEAGLPAMWAPIVLVLMGLVIGIVLWGVHMGFTQGVFSALIADSAPAEFRGTAFGVFHLATGIALLLISLIAGILWDIYGYQLTFLTGAIFALLALSGLGLYRRYHTT